MSRGTMQKKCSANKNYHNNKYLCKICDKSCKSEKTLYTHEKLHHKMKKANYPCNSCARSFPTESQAYKHVKVVHTDDIIKCANCNKSMKPFSLKLHLNICTPKSIFGKVECRYCQKMFSSHHLKYVHIKSCASNQSSKCK